MAAPGPADRASLRPMTESPGTTPAAPFSGDAGSVASYRLPPGVSPQRYELHLAPDLDKATFTGKVRIEAHLAAPTATITMNAADLAVQTATVTAAGGPTHDATTELDAAAERVTLNLGQEIDSGDIVITIEFSGILNDKLHGFYRSTFVDSGGVTRTIATTQFEATDARRAFPCFDEPDAKAVFSITLDVPAGLSAFSNGPIADDEPIDGGHRVRFEDTIPMSTYLVAFVIGPLEATDGTASNGTPLRVVHVPGKEGLTAFALDVAAHALEFFSEFFGLPYPAEKLDLIAIPDFAFGAMENLGCVTFRESALLVDPERASRVELERVADVVSHEIAHMWFGDLVTMKWWNGIWLNEAFATLMELMCVDHFRPDWQRWVSFGAEREVAMATDALHSTRPIEYPVGPPEEAQGMFDVLTYQKGAGVLRMLERYLGPDKFRDGIRRYLAQHRLANTETADLWDALEQATGAPVRSIMDTWILQGGFPVVRADPYDGGVDLAQAPFSYAPPRPGAHSSIAEQWKIPIIARTLPTSSRTGGGQDPGAETRALLGSAPEHLPLDGPGPVVLNSGGSGFYRVAYPAQHLHVLASRMNDLDPLERFNILGDTWAEVVAGRGELGGFLALGESLGAHDDPSVWGEVTGAISFLQHALSDDQLPALAAYTRLLLGPVLDTIGWSRASEEGERVPTLRSQLVTTLGTAGQDAQLRERCASLHADFLAGQGDLDPDLASAVVSVVAASGDQADFDAFLDRYRHPANPQEEVRYLYALAGFEDPSLSQRAFDLALTEVRSQNAPFLISLLLANRSCGATIWRRVEEHWDELSEAFPANILPRMIDGVRLLCRDPSLASEISDFLGSHPVKSGQRTVDQTVERLSINTEFASRLVVSATASLSQAITRRTGL